MSYRALKKLMGETNLERKSRWLLGVIVLVPVALAGAIGAATSVVWGAPSPTLYLDLPLPPEIGLLLLIARQVIPPAIAITAMVPVAVAHDALTSGGSVVGAALSATLLPIGVVALASRWLRSRKRVT